MIYMGRMNCGISAADGRDPGQRGPLTQPEDHLPIGRYRLFFRGPSGAQARGYLGSAWRGVFGHALKGLVCVTKCGECRECMLYRSCVYPYVFDTPGPVAPAKLRGYEAVPHPFLLEADWRKAKGEGGQQVGVTLFGRANQYLAYVLLALRTAGEKGVRPLGPLSLEKVEQEQAVGCGNWASIYEGEGPVRAAAPSTVTVPELPEGGGDGVELEVLTPMRLRRRDEYVTPDSFDFAALFSNLLRRISLLTYFHADRPLETDFAGLTARARGVEIGSSKLRWQEWTRYSSRQQTRMQMGGLMGTVRIGGTPGDLWPYLWLGQWTHVGKGTSMGLGRYRIVGR